MLTPLPHSGRDSVTLTAAALTTASHTHSASSGYAVTLLPALCEKAMSTVSILCMVPYGDERSDADA